MWMPSAKARDEVGPDVTVPVPVPHRPRSENHAREVRPVQRWRPVRRTRAHGGGGRPGGRHRRHVDAR
jgi:hypothetical protein